MCEYVYGGAVSVFSKALTFSGVRPSPNMAPVYVWRRLTVLGQNSVCRDMAVVVIYVGNIGTYSNSKYQRLTCQVWG